MTIAEREWRHLEVLAAALGITVDELRRRGAADGERRLAAALAKRQTSAQAQAEVVVYQRGMRGNAMTKRVWLMVLLPVLLLAAPTASLAQAAVAATPSNHLTFDLPGQAVAVAGSATYTAFVDGAAAGAVVTGLTCVTSTTVSGSTCTVNWPAMTVGTHSLTLTQTISGASSTPSTPLSFQFVVVVTPTNLRAVP